MKFQRDNINMPDFTQPYIQVAGIRSLEEARMLISCGVKYLGFPLKLGYHKEDLNDAEAAAIISAFPDDVHGLLITYLDKAAGIVSLCRFLGVRIVQVHGEIALDELINIKAIDPGMEIIKSLVVRPNNTGELEAAVHDYSDYVDAFITDTFDETTGAMGATGLMHDLSVSRRLSEISPRPVILAGGLNPDNVYDAILSVRPSGVDVHTGVEDARGNKDRLLVREFIINANKGLLDIR